MKRVIVGAAILAMAAGCASTMPAELVNARTAYAQAARSPAATLAPADLHTARETLAVAERSFQENGDTAETKDLAYAAQRRAELAESKARTAAATQQQASAAASVEQMRDQVTQVQATRLQASQQEIAAQQVALQQEAQRRADAERLAAQAAADLQKIAQVKNDQRGLVITISGSVLFASNKSTLLPQAQAKLDQVAQVLSKQGKDAKIRVEGYTDSTGPATLNQQLSQSRADAVRSYLVTRGVPDDRIEAVGLGPANPVADNTSAEGRADNRRVEIVVQNGASANGNGNASSNANGTTNGNDTPSTTNSNVGVTHLGNGR